ncbi:MAG: hypothetical protein V4591_01530 [Bdellovibrionota bacterium]
MAIICASSCNLEAELFYFSSVEEYERKDKQQFSVEKYEFFIEEGSEFECLIAKRFFSESHAVEKYFELIEEYENSITEENLVALSYLFEYENCDVEEALRRMEDVMVFEGSAKDYAVEIYQDEIESKFGRLAYYFDYRLLGQDLVLGGDVDEYTIGYKKYIITS